MSPILIPSVARDGFMACLGSIELGLDATFLIFFMAKMALEHIVA